MEAGQIFKTLHHRGDEGEKASDVTVFRRSRRTRADDQQVLWCGDSDVS